MGRWSKVRRLGAPPSTGTTISSRADEEKLRRKAMARPSGEYAGKLSE